MGPGLVLWSPPAALKREGCIQALGQYLETRKFQRTYNHYIVRWATYEKYKDVLGLTKTWLRSRESPLDPEPIMDRGEDYCFGASKVIAHIMMVQSMFKSYRDLPICLYEFGEIYEPGPPVVNFFGLTLSIFDVGAMDGALAIEMLKVAEIASKHGFNGSGTIRSTVIEDDHYIAADDKKEPVVVTYVDCKLEIQEQQHATRGTEEKAD